MNSGGSPHGVVKAYSVADRMIQLRIIRRASLFENVSLRANVGINRRRGVIPASANKPNLCEVSCHPVVLLTVPAVILCSPPDKTISTEHKCSNRLQGLVVGRKPKLQAGLGPAAHHDRVTVSGLMITWTTEASTM